MRRMLQNYNAGRGRVHVDLGGNWNFAGGYGAQQSSLAAAVGTEKSVAPAVVEFEGGFVQQRCAVEDEAELFDLDVTG